MITVEDALNEFALHNMANGLRAKTRQWYQTMLINLEPLHGEDVTKVTPGDMRRLLVELRSRDRYSRPTSRRPQQSARLSEGTIASIMRAMHRFWAWAAEEYGFENPMRGIRRVKVDPVPKGISSRDFVRLLTACGDTDAGVRDRALLAMLADTGARLGALLSLTIDDLDTKQRRAVVTEKGGKLHVIFWTNFTARLLYQWMTVRNTSSHALWINMNTGEPLRAAGIYEILKRLKERAGVTGRINPHAFRHGFAREYIKSGGDVVTLAKILGHKDIRTTAEYYALFTDHELGEMHDRYSPVRNTPKSF